ncbi:MAPEG family protein [Variovorax sp. PCZ-1]|uniref:MAPEG family protein n=1 Tax=Variovorax sp. PCZ-1 TaxID=2835533 RepID=UPI001BCAFBA4|nr:MAPEG family protein [Variovorax sp. PCZ-1]MBS7807705.1 MAPEG family protein [Variovorax sp. PCZ-1]
MSSVNLTLLFAGCCALLQCALTALVILRRAQTNIAFLDGGDDQLMRRIRAHGNFSETAPMALLLMALLEISGLSNAWLIGFGIALLLGRILHAQSLLTNNAAWSRRGGMVLTLGVISIEAVCALVLFFR